MALFLSLTASMKIVPDSTAATTFSASTLLLNERHKLISSM